MDGRKVDEKGLVSWERDEREWRDGGGGGGSGGGCGKMPVEGGGGEGGRDCCACDCVRFEPW